MCFFFVGNTAEDNKSRERFRPVLPSSFFRFLDPGRTYFFFLPPQRNRQTENKKKNKRGHQTALVLNLVQVSAKTKKEAARKRDLSQLWIRKAEPFDSAPNPRRFSGQGFALSGWLGVTW
jgi:hypothetical protein